MKKTYISPNTEVLVMQAQQQLMSVSSIEMQDQNADGGAAWAPEDKGTFSHAW